MRWKKLGLIFCPDKNYDWMVSHASVPFAKHIKDDLFRVYFSPRDATGRSFVGYADIDINRQWKIIGISEKPVLSPGATGMFDDSGAMLSWMVAHGDKSYLYYIGWNLGVTVPFRNSIGLAVSAKGECGFKKYSSGPVLDRSTEDPCFVASSCVMVEGGKWRMWYLSCIEWEMVEGVPQHRYHIKYAESDDGINWRRDGTVCIDFKSPDEYAISRPCVLKDGDIYKMWYSYRGGSYRIGYAESFDGVEWTRKDEDAGIDVSPSGWDSEMIEYPHVFDHKGRRFMLYNGNEYGRTGFGLAVLEKG
ncbi:MAG: hypothetical protein HY890_01835 [Deltaproteobacteria bacterium]|nr:hypothetical protein [Deltaproteobacteria bacterium]